MMGRRETGAGAFGYAVVWPVPGSGSIPVRAVPLAAFIPSRVPGRGRGAWGGCASEDGQAGPIREAPCPPGAGGRAVEDADRSAVPDPHEVLLPTDGAAASGDVRTDTGVAQLEELQPERLVEDAVNEPGVQPPPADDFNVVSPGDRGSVKRTDVSLTHPDEYVETDSTLPDIHGPHESPQDWADQVNPGNGVNNCGECTHAVQENWEGHPSIAAEMADPDAPGEPNDRMSEWAGTSPEPALMENIEAKLAELGPGSSAIIGCDWTDGGGRWFNAINEDGVITAVDGQSGDVETWSASIDGLGFDQSDMNYSEATYFDANGKVVR